MATGFIALDVETANPDMASICQIGAVRFEDGIVADSWESLVDPQDYFDEINVSVHGIDERQVRGAPTFAEIAASLAERMAGRVVVSHTAFDRLAISRACVKHGLAAQDCRWLDSAQVVRRAWPDRYGKRGYGLGPVCGDLGIQFEHHRAVEDARAAGMCVIRAMEHMGLDIDGWLARVRRSIDPSLDEPIRRHGSSDGPLFGEELVFTGALTISRRQAADLAAAAGCEVASSVRSTTTVLVVGDQDVARLQGHEKSRKHRKAEALIAAGQTIRILRETDFQHLIGLQSQELYVG